MDETKTLVIDDTAYVTDYTRKFERRKSFVRIDPRRMTAFIPGVIRAVWVRPGQRVSWGERVLVLEAMKMKNDVCAPVAGTVKAVHVEVGQMVPKGALLVELE